MTPEQALAEQADLFLAATSKSASQSKVKERTKAVKHAKSKWVAEATNAYIGTVGYTHIACLAGDYAGAGAQTYARADLQNVVDFLLKFMPYLVKLFMPNPVLYLIAEIVLRAVIAMFRREN
jgi:hypothetical protein